MSPPTAEDQLWHDLLTGTHPILRRHRRILRVLPSDPRCKLCNAPFAGMGAPLVRFMGKQRSNLNPQYCNVCDELARTRPGGAEIELTLVFADVRGSTAMAEKMSAGAFGALMNRFYAVATKTFTASDAIIDKLVGDEVIALYLPAFAGPDHVRRALGASYQLLKETGHAEEAGPWLPVGIGIHTGVAYVGSMGLAGGHTEFTALGDAVNVTARLASEAGAGEIVISSIAHAQCSSGSRRACKSLHLAGHAAPVEAVVLSGAESGER